MRSICVYEARLSAKELFNHRDVVLEYRPLVLDGEVKWYWVLLPHPTEHLALAYGSASDKGEASRQARIRARGLKKRILKVRTSYQSPSGVAGPTTDGLADNLVQSAEGAGMVQAQGAA